MNKKAGLLAAVVVLAVLGGALVFTEMAGKPAAAAAVELGQGESYEMTAAFVEREIQGRRHRMLAYNGSIPGPLIRVRQGAEVIINFNNRVDLSRDNRDALKKLR